jgi:hypothetical protein
MPAAYHLVELVRNHVVEAIAATVVLFLLVKLTSHALEQWWIYCALKPIPCDPDQHFLLGHAPRYGWVPPRTCTQVWLGPS